MQKFGKVLVDNSYEDKNLAGHVYRVTGQNDDFYTIEEPSLGECYSVPKDKCKIMESSYGKDNSPLLE